MFVKIHQTDISRQRWLDPCHSQSPLHQFSITLPSTVLGHNSHALAVCVPQSTASKILHIPVFIFCHEIQSLYILYMQYVCICLYLYRYLYCSRKHIHLIGLVVHPLGLEYILIENSYARKIHILGTSDTHCHMLPFLRYEFLTPYQHLVCCLQPWCILWDIRFLVVGCLK